MRLYIVSNLGMGLGGSRISMSIPIIILSLFVILSQMEAWHYRRLTSKSLDAIDQLVEIQYDSLSTTESINERTKHLISICRYWQDEYTKLHYQYMCTLTNKLEAERAQS